MLTTKQIWKVAYPIILGSVAQNILTVTDTAFLGNLGEVALGGGIIGALFYQILLMLGWGVAIGGQIIIARRFGEGLKSSIGQVVEHLLYFLVLFALFIIALVWPLSNPLMGAIVQSPHVLEAGNQYLDYRIFGLLFAFVGYTFNAFYVGIARTKVITATTVVMVAVNIALDYALMFGHWGFPKMGIAGAALASVIAEGAACVAFVVFTTCKFNYREFDLFRFKRLKISIINRILSISWPLMFQFSISVLIWFIFFIFIEKMGELPLAVSNIVRSLYNVIVIPSWGFASATNTFVSQMIGKGKPEKVMPLVYKVMNLAVAAVAVLSLLCLCFGRYAAQIYTNNPAVVDLTVSVMHVVEVAALLQASAWVMFNGVSGTGSTKISFAIEMITMAIYLLWAYLMAIVLKQSLVTVWTCELIYGFFITFLSFAYLKSKRWVGRKY